MILQNSGNQRTVEEGLKAMTKSTSSNDKAIACGFIAIIGRPNVGKSTLMNHMLGQKISITSRKPQTTRHRIVGIKTTADAQLIFVDTPGIHRSNKRTMNRLLNRAAVDSIEGVDIVLFVIEAGRWTEEDAAILKLLENVKAPVILAINKIDKISGRESLLQEIESHAARANFTEIIPLSAQAGTNIAELETAMRQLLPITLPLYPEDQITDRSERFIAAEIIREKLMRRLGQELPYSLAVEIEQFEVQAKVTKISALIWVERDSQKAIVIGKQGAGLKLTGQQARLDMEKVFERKIFLQLWVKVKENWTDDERMLRGLGYSDE